VQVERVEHAGDDRPAARRGEVRLGIDRRAVRAEGHVDRDAAECVGQLVDDLAPEVRVGEPAMHEHEHRPLAALEAVDRALREVDALGLAEQRRPPEVSFRVGCHGKKLARK
jgi:hypothetical protein